LVCNFPRKKILFKEILCEISFAAPGSVIEVGGFRVLLDAVLDKTITGTSPNISESMVITILHLIQFMPNVSADYHLRYLILSISSRHDFQLSHFTSLRKRQTRGFRNNSSSNMLWRSIQRVETRSHIAPPKLAWPGEPLSREVQQFHIRTTRDLLLQFRRHDPPRLTFNSSFRRVQHSKLPRTRARRDRGKIA
jgi:hypothetical protein